MVLDLGGDEWVPDPMPFGQRLVHASDAQLEVLQKLLKSGDKAQPGMAQTGIRSLLEHAHYRRKPLDPFDFFMEDDYLGHVGKYIWPLWLDRLVAILRNPMVREVVLSGAIGCLRTDTTQVCLADGTIATLEDLLGREHADVVCPTVEGQRGSYSREMLDSGYQDTVIVKTDLGGVLQLTPDHKVRVWRDGPVWVPAGELQPGDRVARARRLHVNPPGELTEAEAELLGYWVGDGSMSVERCRARFSDGRIETCERVVELLDQLFEGGRLIDDRPKQESWHINVKNFRTGGFEAFMERVEYRTGSHKVEVPGAVGRSSDAAVAAFLRALFGCEGTVYLGGPGNPPTIQLGMVSRRVIDQVQLLLLRFGILSSVCVADAKNRPNEAPVPTLVMRGADALAFLDKVGAPVSKEVEAAEMRKRLEGKRRNTNIDTVPYTGRELYRLLRPYIDGPVTKHPVHKLSTQVSGLSRERYDWALSFFPEADLYRIPDDTIYVKVRSVEQGGVVHVGDVVSVEREPSWLATGHVVSNTGKSYIARAGICYEIYKVLCLRDAMSIFGNQPGTRVVFAVLGVSGANAKNVMWKYVRDALAESPLFKDDPDFQFHEKASDSELFWPKQNVVFRAGTSQEDSIIGENVIGAALDEANFLINAKQSKRAKQAGELDQAAVLYNALERRRTSRFVTADQSVLARLWLISSKTFPGSFLERRIAILRNKPWGAFMDYPQWLPKMTAAHSPYGKERFHVLLGNAVEPSRMLGDISTDEVEAIKENLPTGCRVQAVPEVLREKYENDFHGAIRDISGWSVLAQNPLFEDHEIYRGCVTLASCGDVKREHPFVVDEPKRVAIADIDRSKLLTQWLNPDGEVYDRSNPRHRQHKDTFARHPLLNPYEIRYVHVDLGRTKDGAGIAIGHHGGSKAVVRKDVIDGQVVAFIEHRPITIIDVACRFYASVGGRIEPAAVRMMIRALFEFGAFEGPGLVTYDLFQSYESVDAWLADGVESHNHKMGKIIKEASYLLMRQAMIDRRFSIYNYEPLWQDCSSLEHDVANNFVDHTAARDDGTLGTKDVSDAVSGVVYHVEEANKIERPATEIVLGGIDDLDHVANAMRDLRRAMGETFMDAADREAELEGFATLDQMLGE